MTIRRGCEVAGGCAVIAGVALIFYATTDTTLRLAYIFHATYLDLGVALAFVGVLLGYLGRTPNRPGEWGPVARLCAIARGLTNWRCLRWTVLRFLRKRRTP